LTSSAVDKCNPELPLPCDQTQVAVLLVSHQNGDRCMHRYIARANIENYLHLLIGIGLGAEKRTMVTKLLIEAENELSHDLEQLEFAERRVADGRERVNRIRNAREAFASDTPEREQADRLLVNVKNLQTILEDACDRLRAKANSE